ncbi:MAG TPA: MFS transporter [Chitinophagaceae bacterium]
MATNADISDIETTSRLRNTGWVKTLSSTFPALQSRNYKLYFSGQLFSLIGTWLQIVAEGWLVLKLTNSAFLIGLVAALATLPSLLFTLFGGVIVDRFPKRKILLITQSCAMVLALLYGILTLINVITIWEIGLLAFLLGLVAAVDAPARQAFVSEIVNRNQLPSAIALNSGAFNSARVVGPAIAGILIAITGPGGAFIANGISYIAVIVALLNMRLKKRPVYKKQNAFIAIKAGLSYSFSHPVIRTLIILTGISSIFGWSYTTLMPYIAHNKFHLDAAGLGSLYVATGLGALLATLIISVFSKKASPIVFIVGGNMLFAVSLLLFSNITNLHIALVLLFIAGFGLISQFSTINTTIQSLVKDEFRGRVMSIYVLMFLGLAPIGNFEVGWLSEKLGTDFAISCGAVIVFLSGLTVFLARHRIREAHTQYKKEHLISLP